MPTIHLLIKGKVQGVFYRATAKNVAEKIGVTGWIKNANAGNVEAMTSGSKEQLQQFISWCKTGPSKAYVTDVIITDKIDETFGGFKIIK